MVDSLDNGELSAPASKKRKYEDNNASGGMASHPSGLSGAPDLPAAQGITTDKEKGLRFKIGDQVVCNMSKRASGFLWKLGRVEKLFHRVDDDVDIPYVVRLENGDLAASPEDHDECIQLAARGSIDTRIMRLFAVSEDTRRNVTLRFSEGDRVAVQLDVCNWEEGVVIEVWAAAERNGKVFKTWKGVAVPYAVDLDIGDTVMVPFDTDEVIKAEDAPRPPQKSVAELIGGTDIIGGPSAHKRFVKRLNDERTWVRVDLKTGVERPCDPPREEDNLPCA